MNKNMATEKEIKYQQSILENLLSGYYQVVEVKNKDESHRAIFSELRRDFERLIDEHKELKKDYAKVNSSFLEEFALAKEEGKRVGAKEVWLAVKDYVSENGVSLSQLNEIINTHLKRIDEMEKGLR